MRGRNVWACTPCALLLLSAVVPREAAALFQGSGARDTVHKVFKVKVTDEMRAWTSDDEDPRLLLLLQQKRGDASACPTSYSLCAASLGGNCCPENYACSKEYCYATTAATSTMTCQDHVGYHACAAALGGGCCPQGLVCATDGCSSPAGATYSMTCPTGYFLCPSSANYGCCMNGMGCAVESCYSTSPSTTTLTYTTSEDGSAQVVTTTSVTTHALPTGESVSTAGVGAVPKYYASTVSKSPATSTSTSAAGGGGGLSKAAIGGIIAGVVVLLIAVVTAAYLIIKRLKKTERVVQSVRETTSGTRTRRTTDKKSEVSQVRVRPTPSEVDQMDYDPLIMNNSSSMGGGSPRASRQAGIRHNLNRRARGDSDAESQRPSLWSGPSAGMRWNTPSVDSDPGGGDSGGNGASAQKEYFELPPRTHVQSTATTTTSDGGRPQMPMRASMESSSQYSYHNYAYGHGRHWSNASELSAGSDDTTTNNNNSGSQQHSGGGAGIPSQPPQELGVEGEFRPELPGSDTETESTHGGASSSSSSRPRPPRRRSTGIVSPMSAIPATTNTTRLPPMTQGSNTASSRRRGNSGNSLISSVEENNNQGGDQQQHRRALGSIDESVSTMAGSEFSKGHLGRPITGLDMAGAPMGLGLSLMGGLDDKETESGQQDGGQGKST